MSHRLTNINLLSLLSLGEASETTRAGFARFQQCAKCEVFILPEDAHYPCPNDWWDRIRELWFSMKGGPHEQPQT